MVDEAIVTRLIALAGASERADWCWAFCGSSGRGESLTRLAPDLVLISDGSPAAAAAYQRVVDLFGECDYLAHQDGTFDRRFFVASVGEWRQRYTSWVEQPILNQTHAARALFDLRPLQRAHPLWREIDAAITAAIDRDFLQIMANDCVARLPPLTFFQDAVVDDMGEESQLFQLERNALTPLVDVARVYGIAAGRVLGGSTQERFAMARSLLPQHQALFREAADTFSIVLWQQGRIGIRQGTGGAELPPSLLSRHDRQVLKSGFRVILELIQLTAGWSWLEAL